MDQPTSDASTVRPITDPPVGDGASHFGAPMPAARQPHMNDTFGQLDGYAEQLRVRLPAAPPGLLDGYMRFVPWLALIFGILGVIFSLLLMIFGAVLAPLMLFAGASGVSAGGALYLALIVNLITAGIEAVGGYLMLQHRATGWWLLALGLVVSLLTNLVHASIIGLVVFALISYIHLQVKPNYR
jgi:hypothetical protein